MVDSKLWVWRNFRAKLPADWEMLQFDRDAAVGRCAFADRYRFRFELCWRQVDGEPDFPRMVSDYKVKLADDGMTHLHDIRYDSWSGLEGRLEGEVVSRLGRYFPGQHCIVELVFIWPEKKDVELLKQIVLSVDEEPAEGALLRTRAFGMDIHVSAGLRLESCSILPARAEMVFEREKPYAREQFCRRGMLSEWLNIPLSEWLRKHFCNDITGNVTTLRREVAGHEVHFLEGTATSKQIFVTYLDVQTAAWICPSDRRLYCIMHHHHPKKGARLSLHDLVGARLACCPHMVRKGAR